MDTRRSGPFRLGTRSHGLLVVLAWQGTVVIATIQPSRRLAQTSRPKSGLGQFAEGPLFGKNDVHRRRTHRSWSKRRFKGRLPARPPTPR